MAEEYLDCQEYFAMYTESGDTEFLSLIAGTLYRERRKTYCNYAAQERARLMKQLPYTTLKGILNVFIYMQEYFIRRSKYSVLFNRTQPQSDIHIGSYHSLYSLSEKGHGSIKEVKAMGIFDYFNLLLKQLIDAVAQLRAAEMPTAKIAEKLNMDMETIIRL
jgi:hypothetical protein